MLPVVNYSYGSVSYIVKMSASSKSFSFFEKIWKRKYSKTKKQTFLSIEVNESLNKEQIKQINDRQDVIYIEKSQRFYTQGTIKKTLIFKTMAS